MQKFFIEALGDLQCQYSMTGENFDHLKVLRPREGDKIVLCDGEGTDYHCSLDYIDKREAGLTVLSRAPSTGESQVRCHIFMAAPKSDKLEHVIQKATELGAVSVTAFLSKYCVSRPDDKSIPKKLLRLQKIAEAAACQCGRGIIPKVDFLPSLEDAVLEAKKSDLPLLLYENEQNNSLRAALSAKEFSSVSVISGPEGGFSREEADFMVSSGVVSCTLGHRILRCETAPLCALSAIMYHCGNY